MLCEPVVFPCKDIAPTAVFSVPVVNAPKAPKPNAEFWSPVVMASIAVSPKAVLDVAVSSVPDTS